MTRRLDKTERVRLSGSLQKQLFKLARRMKRSRSWIIREAIREYIQLRTEKEKRRWHICEDDAPVSPAQRED